MPTLHIVKWQNCHFGNIKIDQSGYKEYCINYKLMKIDAYSKYSYSGS